ncbi:MAG: cohesin domain-containing protein [Clostridia bacterium]|nr:cohesin domain-containing protein [Clostridia bacterium]
MKKTALILLMIVFTIVALSGCGAKEIRADDIKFIEIRAGSFKTEYGVDEKIDFTNVYIVITLKDNKGEVVERVTSEMVEGFDTSTTTAPMDMRAMRVKFKGLYTTMWNYVVSSPYTINTKARLQAVSETVENKYKVELSLTLDEIPEVSGVQIEVTYDATRLDYDDELEDILSGWDTVKTSTKTGTFNLLLYAAPGTQPLTSDGKLTALVFDIKASGTFFVQIKNIHISFGEGDIYLPDIILS